MPLAPYVQDADFTLYVGDVRDVLAGLPDGSVDCVVTSPPYWGLRDYGTGSWEGGDPQSPFYGKCDHAVPRGSSPLNKGFNERWGNAPGDCKQEDARAQLYREICGKCGARRVDRQLGLEATPDAYVANMVAVFREVRRVLAAHGTCWVNLGDSYAANRSYQVSDSKHKAHDFADSNAMSVPDGLKPKDLVGIPWRVAFALQADGWYLRSDIVWSKPNPMPESVTDRPTKSHEYVFLLSKGPRYFFDQEAVREAFEMRPQNRFTNGADWKNGGGAHRRPDGANTGLPAPQDETLDGIKGEVSRGPDGRRATAVKGGDGSIQHRDGERWPNGGRNVRSVWEIATQPYPEAHFATYPEELVRRCILAGCPEGGTVLDPFMGSGTTALVARSHGCHSIGIELNEAYAALCAERLQQLSLLAEGTA